MLTTCLWWFIFLLCGHVNPDVVVWGGPKIRRAMADQQARPDREGARGADVAHQALVVRVSLRCASVHPSSSSLVGLSVSVWVTLCGCVCLSRSRLPPPPSPRAPPPRPPLPQYPPRPSHPWRSSAKSGGGSCSGECGGLRGHHCWGERVQSLCSREGRRPPGDQCWRLQPRRSTS